MCWMDSARHMPSTTAPITAQGGGCACPTAAFVGASGAGPTAALSSVPTSARGTDSASLMAAFAKKGIYLLTLTTFTFYHYACSH